MWQKVKNWKVLTFGLIWLIMNAIAIYFIVDSYIRQGSAWESAHLIIAGLAFMDAALIIALILLGLSNRKIDSLMKRESEPKTHDEA